jgi:4-hydroxybenzoate polyprenyltransferase/phosphoglycolate phosphatase-like HAD superfamily hydrolase
MPEGSPLPKSLVLAVDLDGSLLRSDLLFETAWAGLSQDPINTLRAALAQEGGRAGLKRRLAELAQLDVARLPYNDEVLAYIQRWRADGGRVILVTAADQQLAERVAAHLDVFDEVHGSDGSRNLKGPVKAAFLKDRYGAGGYAYMGDAAADMPVWQDAGRIVTVCATQSVQAEAGKLGAPTEHLGRAGFTLWDLGRAIRPHQWLKNVLVFTPILAAHTFTWLAFWQSLGAFIAFSLVASSVYLVNDLLDLGADRVHPRKHRRALASGAVDIRFATALAPGLLVAGILVGFILGPLFVAALLIYYATTTAYSLHLKRRTIIDIWVLAVLYSLRILAGAAATGIVPSVWLMAFAIFFFFSLAAVKRQAELVDMADHEGLDTRRRGYFREDLLLVAMMSISSGYLSVLVLALYIRTPFVSSLYGYPPMLLGICLVLLYWISRVVMVTHRGHMHDDPLVFAVRDRVSQICLIVCVTIAVVAEVL